MSTVVFEPKEIKKIRSQLGITQYQLAKEAGVSQSLIAKIEAGTIDPSFKTVAAITRALRSRLSIQDKKVKDVMSKPVIYASTNTSLKECIARMKEHGISQLPIVSNGRVVGSITESHILSLLSSSDDKEKLLSSPVSLCMQDSFPQVGPETPLEAVRPLFSFFPAVLVVSEDRIEGIITKIDVISAQTGV